MIQNTDAIDAGSAVPRAEERDGDQRDIVVPVIAEVAEVSKLEEHTGTVRVRKQTQLDEVDLDAPLEREIVETRRVQINLPVDKAQAAHYRGDVWVVPVYEERLVKTLFLVEELHLVKRVEQTRHNETVTLRREVLVTERFDFASNAWVTDPS